MKEKLSNIVACRLGDTELQQLVEHLDELEKRLGFPVRASQVVLGFIREGLAAAGKSTIFPAHPPLAGKIVRRASKSSASNVIKLKQSA